jgi:hypothetical protein
MYDVAALEAPNALFTESMPGSIRWVIRSSTPTSNEMGGFCNNLSDICKGRTPGKSRVPAYQIKRAPAASISAAPMHTLITTVFFKATLRERDAVAEDRMPGM